MCHGCAYKEYRAVEDQDQVENPAPESGHVADHYKLIGVLDRLAQRLMTSTKFSDASSKLAAEADSSSEVLVQCSELVVEDAADHVVHWL